MKAAEALVQILVKEGITDAFGIPGAGINAVYQYLEHAPISHYCMRHEEACTHGGGRLLPRVAPHCAWRSARRVLARRTS